MPRELHIKTFEWKGQMRYSCPEPGCPFDTYTLNGREGMLYHIAKSHSAKPVAPVGPTPQLFDGSGKELKPEPEIVGDHDVVRVLKKQGLGDAQVHLYPQSRLTKEQAEDAVRSDSPRHVRGEDTGQEFPVPGEE